MLFKKPVYYSIIKIYDPGRMHYRIRVSSLISENLPGLFWITAPLSKKCCYFDKILKALFRQSA
jgi:hypothetical protein